MEPRKVFIATPSHSGKVTILFAQSLAITFRKAVVKNIQVEFINTRCDALVQKSRNYFVAQALKQGATDLIFIDDDIHWDPEWIFKLIEYPVDVVSGMYRKKFDSHEEYPFLPWEPLEMNDSLVRAAGVPTGFLRLTRKAMQTLWDASEIYTNGILPEERAIFDLKIEDGIMYSEDYVMSKKLTDAGIPLWIDPNMTCNHEGPKVFEGNFANWLTKSVSK
jgi:hypothetical protein